MIRLPGLIIGKPFAFKMIINQASIILKEKLGYMKVELISASRYNGGVKIKRVWGSSTVTEFFVIIDGVQQKDLVKGYGKTPGDRKTFAKNKVIEEFNLKA